MLQYQFRPLEVWPEEKTKYRTVSPFSAPWSRTLDLLEKELWNLGAKNVVLQAAVTLADIRNDGMLRANSRPSWPGVILSFETSKLGELSYPCDAFNDWQANVRAIALALEALRKVDRYGVTKRSEQYKGWARIEGPGATAPPRDLSWAVKFMKEAARMNGEPLTRTNLDDAYRRACTKTHPDAGGSATEFKLVQEAKAILDRQL